MLAAAALFAILAAPRDGLSPRAGEPGTARCHMGECSWFAVLRRETVRRTAQGRLLRLVLLGGRSASAQGEDYAAAYGPDARVEWDAAPHDLWVFCSPRLPAVMTRRADGRVQAALLNFADQSPPAQEGDRSLYVRACHDGAAGEDFASRHGYGAPAAEEIELTRPEDIFGHVGRERRPRSFVR